MKIEKWFQILLFFCTFRSSLELLTFLVENNDDGEWSFLEGSNVTLVCTYRPYRGIHRFVFNSTNVSACTGTKCITIDNDQGGFSFIHNTDSGIFTWIINTVHMKYNNKSFVCIDVDDEIQYIATVEVKGYSKVSYQNDEKIDTVVGAVLGPVTAFSFIIATFFFIRKQCPTYYSKLKKLLCSTEPSHNSDYNMVSVGKE